MFKSSQEGTTATANSDLHRTLAGLTLSADDYLGRPYFRYIEHAKISTHAYLCGRKPFHEGRFSYSDGLELLLPRDPNMKFHQVEGRHIQPFLLQYIKISVKFSLRLPKLFCLPVSIFMYFPVGVAVVNCITLKVNRLLF